MTINYSSFNIRQNLDDLFLNKVTD